MNDLFFIRKVKCMRRLYYDEFAIKEGRVTFIVGSSGSGKSTLCRLLNATVPYDAGEILYRGTNIAELDTIQLRREVIFMAQAVFLFADTIANNFIQFYTYRDLIPPDKETMRAYLDLCLANFDLDKSCVSLSGGERQRVYLAIGLSLRPRVFMIDEPTSALDSKSAVIVLQRIKKHCLDYGISLIIISHDEQLIALYADDIIALERE